MMPNTLSMTTAQPALTFRLAERIYAFTLDQVLEVCAMMELIPTPDAPLEVLGMINRQGVLLPLIDLRLVMGIPASPIGLHTLFIVVTYQTHLLGVVVDDVLRVEYLPMKQLQQTGAWGKYIYGMLSNPQQVIQFIAIEALMASYGETFLKVD